jgi:S-phase kinase-associated protein 1
MVLLVTSDNESFNVDKEVAERSVLIKNMLEGKYSATPRSSLRPISDHLIDVGETDNPIPLPNLTSAVLKKVRSFLRHAVVVRV